MKNSNDVIYEMTINGILYRGTRDELSQIIADYRENHD
jgi:hypothetical protein